LTPLRSIIDEALTEEAGPIEYHYRYLTLAT
jgi:hypothetical protein